MYVELELRGFLIYRYCKLLSYILLFLSIFQLVAYYTSPEFRSIMMINKKVSKNKVLSLTSHPNDYSLLVYVTGL